LLYFSEFDFLKKQSNHLLQKYYTLRYSDLVLLNYFERTDCYLFFLDLKSFRHFLQNFSFQYQYVSPAQFDFFSCQMTLGYTYYRYKNCFNVFCPTNNSLLYPAASNTELMIELLLTLLLFCPATSLYYNTFLLISNFYYQHFLIHYFFLRHFMIKISSNC
jgi:hypothetical protein